MQAPPAPLVRVQDLRASSDATYPAQTSVDEPIDPYAGMGFVAELAELEMARERWEQAELERAYALETETREFRLKQSLDPPASQQSAHSRFGRQGPMHLDVLRSVWRTPAPKAAHDPMNIEWATDCLHQLSDTGVADEDEDDAPSDGGHVDHVAAVHQHMRRSVLAARASGALERVEPKHVLALQRPVASGAFAELASLVLGSAATIAPRMLDVAVLGRQMAMYMYMRSVHPDLFKQVESTATKLISTGVRLGESAIGMATAAIRSKMTEMERIKSNHDERLRAQRARLHGQWLKDMGAVPEKLASDNEQRVRLLKEFRDCLDESKNRLSTGLERWGLVRDEREFRNEVQKIKRLRTTQTRSLDSKLDARTINQINHAYVQWLDLMKDFVHATRYTVQDQRDKDSGFAEQVALLSGVAASTLTGGQGSLQTTLQKLKKFLRQLETDKIEADAYLADSLRELSAPSSYSVVDSMSGARSAEPASRAWATGARAPRARLPPADLRHPRPSGATYAGVAGNTNFDSACTRRAWVELVWRDCFGWGDGGTRRLGFLLSAPMPDELVDLMDPVDPGSTQSHGLGRQGVQWQDIQTAYNELFSAQEVWSSDHENLMARLAEEYSEQTAYIGFRRNSGAHAVHDWRQTPEYQQYDLQVSDIAARMMQHPMLHRVIVHALRLQAREREPGMVATELLSDFPLRATLSGDARDYDVFDWPCFAYKDKTAAGFPSRISLAYVLYATILADIYDQITTTNDGTHANLPYKVVLKNTSADTDSANTERYSAIADSLWTHEAVLKLSKPSSDEEELSTTYTIDTTNLLFARERDLGHDIPSIEECISQRFGIPDTDLFGRSSDRLRHGIELAHLNRNAAEYEYATGILPTFYELSDPLNLPAVTRPDLLLLRDHVEYDFGIRLWLCYIEEGADRSLALCEVFWPVFCETLPDGDTQDNTCKFRTRQLAAPEGKPHCLEVQLAGPDATLYVVVRGLDGEEELTSSGNLSTDTRDRLRRIHILRVHAERDLAWTSTWHAGKPYLVESKMQKNSKEILRAVVWGTGRYRPVIECNFENPRSTDAIKAPGHPLLHVLTDPMRDKVRLYQHTWVVGDTPSIRHCGEWAQASYAQARDYGVCPDTVKATDDWFVRRCWETAPAGFEECVCAQLRAHLVEILERRVAAAYDDRRSKDNRLLSFFNATVETNNVIVAAAERERTATLVYQMATKVAADLQRQFGEHLMDPDYGPLLLMDPQRNDLYANFYSMVAFEVMYHRRMNGIRTTYAGDARRQQQEYRLHKYVFRNARIVKYVRGTGQVNDKGSINAVGLHTSLGNADGDLSLGGEGLLRVQSPSAAVQALPPKRPPQIDVYLVDSRLPRAPDRKPLVDPHKDLAGHPVQATARLMQLLHAL